MSYNRKKIHRNNYRKKGNIPYLGKINLYWCEKCDIPLLDNFSCETCNSSAIQVKISPPGDVRPAFYGDIKLIRDAINSNYGKGVGDLLIPSKRIVLLNRIGGLDRTEEVIMFGNIIGILLFDPFKQKFEFQPRLIGAILLLKAQEILGLSLKQIEISSDSIPFVFEGKSILAPGVKHISSDLQIKDYAIIVYNHPEMCLKVCVGVGITRNNNDELIGMLNSNHGQIAKNKEHLKSWQDKPFKFYLNMSTKWDQILNNNLNFESENISLFKKYWEPIYHANYTYIQSKINTAIKFIQNTIKKVNKPVAVAYSGGKDSLGVLLLAFKALGPNFKIFFADTGLELPEVQQNIQAITKTLNMESKIIIKYAKDVFWDLVESFGPPGRDYRFCCHTLKAQQIMDIINTIYDGEKVLVFLGQRQYESISRAESEMVYVNSFIPLQIAATPIKSWNSLLLWVFLLFEPTYIPGSGEKLEIPITPLYFEGQERLGCYLCPAANLSSFKLLEKSHPELHSRWFDFLNKYRRQYGLPEEWVDLGLWRFKRLSPQWKLLIEEIGIDLKINMINGEKPLNFEITKGFSPCLQSGYSVKAKFSQAIDLEAIQRFLPAITNDFQWDESLNIITIKSTYLKAPYRLNIFPDGSLFLISSDRSFKSKTFLKLIVGTVFRTIFCNNCNTCVSICPHKAIMLNSQNLIEINPKLCSSCNLCITHCPLYQNAKKLIE